MDTELGQKCDALLDEAFVAMSQCLVANEAGDYLSYDGTAFKVIKDYDDNFLAVTTKEINIGRMNDTFGCEIFFDGEFREFHPEALIAGGDRPHDFLEHAKKVIESFVDYTYMGLVRPEEIRPDLSICFDLYFCGPSRAVNYRKEVQVDPCVRLLSSMTQNPLVQIQDADYILFTHAHALFFDQPNLRGHILQKLDKERKPGAKIVAIGGAVLALDEVDYPIKDVICIQGDYVRELEKLFGVSLKPKTVNYDSNRNGLMIVPCSGCRNKCGMCTEGYKNRDFSSVPLEEIKRELDHFQRHWPESMQKIQIYATNLSQYGTDLYRRQEFPALLDLVASYPEVERISLDYGLTIKETRKPEMLSAIIRNKSKISTISLHFETGSNRLLGIIGKGHTKQQAIELLNTMRRELPNVSILSSMMIGLPTETMRDIDESVDLIRKTSIDGLLVSPYSQSPKQRLQGQQESIKHKKLHFLYFLQKLKDAGITHPLRVEFNANPPVGFPYEVFEYRNSPVYYFGNHPLPHKYSVKEKLQETPCGRFSKRGYEWLKGLGQTQITQKRRH